MTIGWVTLHVGEQALVYSLEGAARIEQGPKRLFLWREKYIPMLVSTASQNEYLIIKYCNGKVEHRPGPCAVFCNPLTHISIDVESGINLDANEVLVVYRSKPETKEVSRYIQHGPTLFVPSAHEWLHQFEWHGTNPSNKTKMIPKGKTFTKLQVVPDQFYYNLNETKDPIADFINCLSADVVAFASDLTYLEFIERSGGLNDLKNYPQLLERCRRIGYDISKVVFRGYYAAPVLQKMHDNAIATRTNLKLQYEEQQQDQLLTDQNMKAKRDRIALEQSIELEKLQHTHNMESSELSHKVELMKLSHMEHIQQETDKQLAILEAQKAQDEQKVMHFHDLKSLEVDLTPYILSCTPTPRKVVKVVADENSANLHLHHN